MSRFVLLMGVVVGLVVGLLASAARGGVVMFNDGSFSYQGYMEEDGEPANGMYSFRFEAFNDPGGIDIASEFFFVSELVPVVDGLFVVNVQMGGSLANARAFWESVGDRVLYLEIGVGEFEGGPYETLGTLVPMGWGGRAQYSMFAEELVFPYTDSFTDESFDLTTMISLTSVAGGTVLEAVAGTNASPSIIRVASATASGTNFGAQNGAIQVDALGRFIGVLSYADQFAVAGLLLEDTGAQEAAVLAQVSTGVVDADAIQALNFHSGTEARLGTPEYAGDFNGDVIVRNKLRVWGAAERDYAIGSPSPIGPLAYASVSSVANVTSGTANISAVWNAVASQYEVSVAGEFLDFTTHTVSVTVVDANEPRLATILSTPSGAILVKIWDLNSGNIAVQDNFSIVIYDADSVTLNRASVPAGVDRDKYVERTGAALIETRPRHEPVELKKAAGLQAQE